MALVYGDQTQTQFLVKESNKPSSKERNSVIEDSDGSGNDATSDVDDDNFFRVKKHDEADLQVDDSEAVARPTGGGDCCKFSSAVGDWSNPQLQAEIRDRFVTGNWVAKDKSKEEKTAEKGDDDEVYGDFEDLEKGIKYPAAESANKDETTDKAKEAEQPAEDETARQKRKEELKAKFNSEYDKEDEDEGITMYDDIKQQMDSQRIRNKEEFADMHPEERAELEGVVPGKYVRLIFQGMPCEFVKHFDPHFPLIAGALLQHEDTLTFLQCRIKKHRWYSRLLRNNDPLIVSLGWRRFQTRPLLCLKDTTGRVRMLKYSPDHLHCMCTFYAPTTPPNTAFCAFQSLSNNQPGFRVAATGVVLEMDASFQIVKKLKLRGYPFKSLKNTVFIKGMFTSALEVAKFEGASLKTVSGLRGQIKKAVTEGPSGSFRATFEDRLLLSDIVFLKAWYPVEPDKFFYPVSSHLLTDKASWTGMKTIGRLRAEKGLTAPVKYDSLKKEGEGEGTRKFNPLKIPKGLLEELPFNSRPKLKAARKNKDTYKARRAVVIEPEERKAKALIHTLNTLRNARDEARKKSQKTRHEKQQKEKVKEDAKKLEKRKVNMKRRFIEDAHPGMGKKIKRSDG